MAGTGSYPGGVTGGAGGGCEPPAGPGCESPGDIDSVTGEIIEHLFALVDRLRAGFERVVAGFELSPPQAKALHYVSESGPVPMRDLACRLRCDASNVTGIVDRLEQRGLVRRETAADRRVKSLVATDRGAEVARAVWIQVRSAPVGVRGLSPAECAELLRLLRRLDHPAEHDQIA